MKKPMLIAGGVVIAGLLAFQAYSHGMLPMPSAISSMFSSNAGPMKRDFPRGGPDASAEEVAGTEALNDGTSPIPADAAATDAAPAGETEFVTEDVNARIARAMELSKTIVTTDSAQTSPATPAQPARVLEGGLYSTAWTGQYLGPDAGTISIAVQADGSVQGQGVSTLTGLGFTLTGKMQSNGQIELTQSAASLASAGAVFTGTLAKSGRGAGTWAVSSYNVSGTWELAPAQ